MKSFEELKKTPRLTIEIMDADGFKGTVTMMKWSGSVICSTGAGWEHVSVAPFKRNIVPTWEDMCKVKEMFWNDDEAVIQIHPPASEYVNNMPNRCGRLHGRSVGADQRRGRGKMMIRRCDVGKVLFCAHYNVKELPGFRFTVGKITITEVSFDGRFRAEEYDLWVPNDFIDVDRMFWRSWECEEYCRRRNAQEFRRMMNRGKYSRAS